MEALRNQAVGSPTDIIELSIRFMIRNFRFKEGRMRVIDFLEFLALEIQVFSLKLILYQVHFDFHLIVGFGVEPMLVFNMNHFKSLDQC